MPSTGVDIHLLVAHEAWVQAFFKLEYKLE